MSLPQNEDKSTIKTWVEPLKDAITILGGTSLVIVVLFLYFGRMIVRGYFSTLNIPYSRVSFSDWQLGETSAPYIMIGLYVFIALVFFIMSSFINKGSFLYRISSKSRITLIALCSFGIIAILFNYQLGLINPKNLIFTSLRLSIHLFAIIILLSIFLILGYVQNYCKKQAESKSTNDNNRVLISRLKDILFYSGLFVFLLFAASLFFFEVGVLTAYSTISNRLNVRIILDKPLLDNSFNKGSISPEGNSLFIYEGLSLLTYNNGNYFLFNEVGVDCKPKIVYVIIEEHVQSLEYISRPAPRSDCIPEPTPMISTSSSSSGIIFVTVTPTPP